MASNNIDIYMQGAAAPSNGPMAKQRHAPYHNSTGTNNVQQCKVEYVKVSSTPFTDQQLLRRPLSGWLSTVLIQVYYTLYTVHALHLPYNSILMAIIIVVLVN